MLPAQCSASPQERLLVSTSHSQPWERQGQRQWWLTGSPWAQQGWSSTQRQSQREQHYSLPSPVLPCPPFLCPAFPFPPLPSPAQKCCFPTSAAWHASASRVRTPLWHSHCWPSAHCDTATTFPITSLVASWGRSLTVGCTPGHSPLSWTLLQY